MDTKKIGNLIHQLRCEHKLTQLQLADQLHISDKTISKEFSKQKDLENS